MPRTPPTPPPSRRVPFPPTRTGDATGLPPPQSTSAPARPGPLLPGSTSVPVPVPVLFVIPSEAAPDLPRAPS